VFGPSTPGALNLISGQTNGIVATNGISSTAVISDRRGGQTMIGDTDPYNDVCSTTTGATTRMASKNVGDLLSAANVSWGWFNGGFNLQAVNTKRNYGA
jgi:phospholipase C